MEPRKATEDEKKELLSYLVEHDDYAIEDIEDTVDGAYTAVFDDYTTGGPGYFGKVMVVVYDGYPSQTETYIWDRHVLPGEERIPLGQIDWHDGRHEPKLTRVELEAA